MFELNDLIFKTILNIPLLRIDGQLTCVLGPSGSGKSTLLRLLNGLNAPTSGVVQYKGRDIRETNPIQLRRRVVMLGQTPVLYPGNIEDNLQMGLSFSLRPPANDAALRTVLAHVGLDKHPSEGCATLSGGERQRLCLARVLLIDAECYLLDEPFAALDGETERFVMEQLTEFSVVHGRQLITATHSEAVAQRYPHNVVQLENGCVKGIEA